MGSALTQTPEYIISLLTLFLCSVSLTSLKVSSEITFSIKHLQNNNTFQDQLLGNLSWNKHHENSLEISMSPSAFKSWSITRKLQGQEQISWPLMDTNTQMTRSLFLFVLSQPTSLPSFFPAIFCFSFSLIGFPWSQYINTSLARTPTGGSIHGESDLRHMIIVGGKMHLLQPNGSHQNLRGIGIHLPSSNQQESPFIRSTHWIFTRFLVNDSS